MFVVLPGIYDSVAFSMFCTPVILHRVFDEYSATEYDPDDGFRAAGSRINLVAPYRTGISAYTQINFLATGLRDATRSKKENYPDQQAIDIARAIATLAADEKCEL
jgi:hypothetical protein